MDLCHGRRRHITITNRPTIQPRHAAKANRNREKRETKAIHVTVVKSIDLRQHIKSIKHESKEAWKRKRINLSSVFFHKLKEKKMREINLK